MRFRVRATGAAEVNEQVALRMYRQRSLFARHAAPTLVTVLNEAVLTRPVGGDAVLKAQIVHLQQVHERHGADIRVLPWSVGAHAAMTGAFRILTFDDPADPDVVYLEQHTGAMYLEEPAQLAGYGRIFDLLTRDAVPIGQYR